MGNSSVLSFPGPEPAEELSSGLNFAITPSGLTCIRFSTLRKLYRLVERTISSQGISWTNLFEVTAPPQPTQEATSVPRHLLFCFYKVIIALARPCMGQLQAFSYCVSPDNGELMSRAQEVAVQLCETSERPSRLVS